MNTTMMIAQSRDYWTKELQLPLPGFHLYTDHPAHTAELDILQATYTLDIRPANGQEPDNAWLLSAYAALLYQLSQDKDLLIGVKNRRGNLLPMRITMSGTDAFEQLYEQIKDKLNRVEDSLESLADIEKITGQPLSLKTVYGKDHSHKDSWINWSVYKEGSDWKLKISYSKRLFEESTIHKFKQHFQQLIYAAMENMGTPISALTILTDDDQEAYAKLNDTNRKLTDDETIVAMLDSVVSKYSERIALSYYEDQLSYGQLDRLSNQIAHMLISKGLRKGQFVSLFLDRGLDTIVCLLGIMKAGGAYVPLDPAHPDDRNAYIISDTKSHLIMTQEKYISKLSALLDNFETKPQLLLLDSKLEGYSEDSCNVDIEPDDLAYVIYTSGSTGKPKGALIGHQGVVNLAKATQENLGLTEQDYILQYSTFSFDASVYDLFSSLASGARLHLLTDEQRFSIDSFTDAVENTEATHVALLPTVFFNQLAAYLPENAREIYRNIQSIVVGGEALTGETARLFQKKLQVPVINLYGPTEITAVATAHKIDYIVPDELSTVYIGRPMANYELYVVNENNQLCPTCVTGELLISSIGVAKGYLNQPEKTKEVFISDPINQASGKKFYRTGDMVRLLPNGEVEYRGRKDSQVKIRGFRIEIGEIEDNLAKHEGVKDVAVIPVTEDDGTKMLAGFYTSSDGQATSSKELVQFLSKKVPSYMVPKYMCFLKEMPLSPTGKIDRKKLATYELTHEEVDSDYIAPVTDLQRQVSEAWEKALSQPRISIHDDFFEIGGYSLKILEILVVLKPSYPQLKINDFFVYPTIAKLSERIEELAQEASISQQSEDVDGPIQDLSEYPLSFSSPLDSSKRVFSQKNILLTGATGYLGSHLLYELLRRSEATIYCLVRPNGALEPYARLEQTMSGYFGEKVPQLMANRVVAVQGDLEQEHLGFSEEVRAIVESHVDSIIHCGAEVKHFGDSEYFARVNIESTNRLLELAKSKPDMRFHFISTLGIPEELALNGQWESIVKGTGYESAFVENVYTNSKLEAEKLVVRAGEEHGIAASVYRVGNLSCHSGNGVFQRNIDNNAFYRMLKAMLLLKNAPSVQWEVDITPIDYASESITALALQDATVGRVFHICNPVAIPYEQMIRHFVSYGYEITLQDWNDYEAWLFDTQYNKDQTGLELAMAQLEGDGAKNSIYRFACPQTNQFLENTGVKCADLDESFFKHMIDYAVSIGYFTKPE
ncbi:amino acid adenylation domain-containing protein [Paenibacillus sp. HJL G12]|uniref:Amino acid adenylation domain-containing protein n=1 Tax=Paenibacillus dendrobii TaxID=2691084 RepID=A0A7X3LG59_9BACL|nr:non-ribosomal peptide synthetase [Paenibacillus dendrobii]MWV42875.1 amino acid adenylation domain-containing protein [Paenibacillus dendrobii]